MTPWYKGFKGSITASEKEEGRFDVVGIVEKKSYKEFLEELMPAEGKKDESSDSKIEDFREYHTENSVHFVVTLTPEKMQEVEKAGLEKTFRLKSSVCTTNMVLFDAEGKITKYNSALDVLTDFCKPRRQLYEKRKAHIVAKLNREREILSNKARFIKMVVKGELELRKRKKDDLLKDLRKRGFKPMSEIDAMLEGEASGATAGGEAEGESH